MNPTFSIFALRWALNSFGLWIAVHLIGDGYADHALQAPLSTYILAGLVFSLVNAVGRPVLVILSLPVILLTLGLFTLVVSGILVYLSLALIPGLHMTFIHSIFTGIVISLVNYIVSGILELRHADTRRKHI